MDGNIQKHYGPALSRAPMPKFLERSRQFLERIGQIDTSLKQHRLGAIMIPHCSLAYLDFYTLPTKEQRRHEQELLAGIKVWSEQGGNLISEAELQLMLPKVRQQISALEQQARIEVYLAGYVSFEMVVATTKTNGYRVLGLGDIDNPLELHQQIVESLDPLNTFIVTQECSGFHPDGTMYAKFQIRFLDRS